MLNGLDLNLLPVIVAIYEERSVTLAAQRLGLSQPDVSKALGKLRASLKDPLFLKTSHGMEATVKTKAVVETAREMFSRLQRDALMESQFSPGSPELTFSFALSEVGELFFLPNLIKALRAAAPGAGVVSLSPTTDEITLGLESGSIDLVIGYVPDLNSHNIFRQKLFTSQLACVMRADHPIAGNQLTRKQFNELQHVIVQPTGRANSIFQLARSGKSKRNASLIATSHFLSLPKIIENTDAVAVVFRPLAIHLVSRSVNLKIVSAPILTSVIDVQQCWHRKFHDTPKSKWLRGLVRDLFSEERDDWLG